MLIISKRMVKQWCKVDGQPGYLLTTGAKIKQSAVRFEEEQCKGCGLNSLKEHDPRRLEAYIRRFGYCLNCHSVRLFPLDTWKQAMFRLRMSSTKTLVLYGARYFVDQMTRTVVRQVM